MSGFPQNPVLVTATGSFTLEMTNNIGYNDVGQVLNGSAAPVAQTSAATCSTPYFGPSLVQFVNGNGTSITLFSGNATVFNYTIPAGGFVSLYLANAYDLFYLSTATGITNFTWTGK
jgi:hypothetical protein